MRSSRAAKLVLMQMRGKTYSFVVATLQMNRKGRLNYHTYKVETESNFVDYNEAKVHAMRLIRPHAYVWANMRYEYVPSEQLRVVVMAYVRTPEGLIRHIENSTIFEPGASLWCEARKVLEENKHTSKLIAVTWNYISKFWSSLSILWQATALGFVVFISIRFIASTITRWLSSQ